MKRILSLLALAAALPLGARTFDVASPDGRQSARIDVTEEDGCLRLSYSTALDGRAVVLPSALDLTVDNHIWEMALGKRSLPVTRRWMDSFVLEGVDETAHDASWHNAFGERSTVRDAYRGLILHFVRHDGSDYRLDVEFRAYDEGIAFRYYLPMHPDAVYHRVVADNTEFAFPEGTQAWYHLWAQAGFEKRPLAGWTDECERPLTLQLADDLFAAVGEAGVVDFPRGKLRLVRPGVLAVALNDTGTDLVTPYAMPWRVVMAADRLGGLLEQNDIFLNLNEASKLQDTDWIRPGKIIRETRLTTENSKACIDFAARHGLNYILYDWKWYGPSFDFHSDATQVVAPIDMPEVIRYGAERGVGVWVYVNQHALQEQGASLFPVYEKWGLKGIKFGFVQFTSQHWADWVHGLVRAAADSHLMVNIHDEYRPTGYSRTYPNLITQEGICGNEEWPSATHNTILPFTRMICGAADYTVCYFDPRLKNTHAHQLALPVMYFSPLQTLFWYDTPDRIVEVPELEFFERVPTVWDETRVVDDRIGTTAAIVRRSGADWYLGLIGNDDAQSVRLSADWLAPDTPYVMSVYTDDPSVDTATHVAVRRFIVRNGDVLPFSLLPRGGAAATFVPASKADLKTSKKLSKKVVL
ncbi:MAG: glycoside hydrolase family 97 catalytic domain-containing protein [Bacteroidales bacterium]|nr:glycoside hydrolase family 97 catalytic domain-containing protein [Bacteroidales bacterium]